VKNFILIILSVLCIGSFVQAQTYRVWQGQTISCCDHRGDVNQDGEIDIADFSLLLAYIDNRGPIGCYEAADLDNDGNVDISDLSLMINFLFIDFCPFVNCDKTLLWTATGDNGIMGQAIRYDLRYSSDSMELLNWTTATPIPNLPLPSVSGEYDSVVVFMNPDSVYYFGLKVMNKTGEWSDLSNVVKSWIIVKGVTP